MQKLQDSMDGLLLRSDLGEYDKAKHYMQLQNRYLTFKQQLNLRPRTLQEPMATQATPVETSLPSSILTPPPTVP